MEEIDRKEGRGGGAAVMDAESYLGFLGPVGEVSGGGLPVHRGEDVREPSPKAPDAGRCRYRHPFVCEDVDAPRLVRWLTKFYGPPSAELAAQAGAYYRAKFWGEDGEDCDCAFCALCLRLLDAGYDTNNFWSKCLVAFLFGDSECRARPVAWNERSRVFAERGFVRGAAVEEALAAAVAHGPGTRLVLLYKKITTRNADVLYKLTSASPDRIYCAPLKVFLPVHVPLALRCEVAVLTREEVRQLEREFKIRADNLPLVYDDDPLVIKIHAVAGQVIRSVALSDSSKIPTYRLCTRQRHRYANTTEKMTSQKTTTSRQNRMGAAFQYY